MTLADYIKSVGDQAFAEKFGVTTRAVMSWRLGTRTPRRETAQKIVAGTPVTWDGIYGARPTGEGEAA